MLPLLSLLHRRAATGNLRALTEQTLTPEAYRAPNRDFIKNQMKQGEWTVPDYDVVVSYWVHNPADVGKVTADPEWQELEKDAPAVTKQTIGHLVLGHEIVAFTSDAMPKV